MQHKNVLPDQNPFAEILEKDKAKSIMSVLSCYWSKVCHEPETPGKEPTDLLWRFLDEESRKERRGIVRGYYGRDEWQRSFLKSTLFRYLAVGCFVRWLQRARNDSYEITDRDYWYPAHVVIGTKRSRVWIASEESNNSPFLLEDVIDAGLGDEFTESPPEHLFFHEYRAALRNIPYAPALIPQVWIGYRYRLDFALYWKGQKYAVEIDGQEYHASQEDRARDAQRARVLNQEGYQVIRFTAKEVLQDARRCVIDLCRIAKLI